MSYLRIASCVVMLISFSLHASENKYATAKDLKLMEGFPPPKDKQVNKDNALLTAPFNRWSYLHMRNIFPSAPVKTADQSIELKKKINNKLNDLKIPEPGKKEPSSLKDFLTKTYTDSLIIIKNDTIVYEQFLNGMSPAQPHQMMSATKSFAGLLGLMAVAEGKVSESDIISKHIPELKGASAFNDATLGQVLNMTNSMEFTEDYADPRSGIRKYGAVIGWTPKVKGIKYENNLYEYLMSLQKDPKVKHGEIFHYQTPKTDVINWVLNRSYNKNFQELLYDKVWSKIGTTDETYVLLDTSGVLVAGGGLNTSPYNLARFATMMINDGKIDGKSVVPSQVIKTLSKGGDIEAFNKGPDSDNEVHLKDEWSYRAQWWVKHTPGQEAISAIGIHGQWIYLAPKYGVAIVKLSSQPKSKDVYLNLFDLNAFSSIVEALKEPSALSE